MKPLPLGIVNSSVVQRVIQNIEGFLKEEQVGEAATLAISCLSSSDNDTVGCEHCFGLFLFFRLNSEANKVTLFVLLKTKTVWAKGSVLD